MLDVVVFNVEHGQSIFLYPRNNPRYGMLIDCGNTAEFEPVDFLIENNLLHHDGNQYVLGNLVLTNYDHDHFSGLPYLMRKVGIWTTSLAQNLSSGEIINLKPEITDPLKKVCHLKDAYIYSAPEFIPPYIKRAFYLEKHHFHGEDYDTNNLSQVIFVEYAGSTICVCGDIEEKGWEILLKDQEFLAWLNKTDALITAHHGREGGYAEEVFNHCWPECIIMSDKEIIHGTQEGMSQAYANNVLGDGICLLNNSAVSENRKVLTTRNDGHVWIRLLPNGVREYRNIPTS